MGSIDVIGERFTKAKQRIFDRIFDTLNEQQREAAAKYAKALGLAFQIRDDMLDVLGDAAKLGKATHVDENKNTFVRLYGIGACSKMIESETKTAIDALGCFENSDFLVEMARQLALREY